MNVIEIHGTRFSIGDDLVWRYHGGTAHLLPFARALNAMSRGMQSDLGPHADPTPAGYIAFETAKKLGAKVVSLDDNESHGNPNLIH